MLFVIASVGKMRAQLLPEVIQRATCIRAEYSANTGRYLRWETIGVDRL